MHQLTQIENGLAVVTIPLASIETAAIGLHFGAGTRDEPEGAGGVAHMVEHMVFKGTRRRSARAIAEEVEDVGGQLNAYTARDTTVFHARVLAADVPLAVDVIADLVTGAALDAAEIEKERLVVLQELGEAYDTPDDIVHDNLQGAAWAGQPLGRAVLGTQVSIEALSVADCRRFIDAAFVGHRAVLVGAGRVVHDALVELAERHLGGLPSGGAVASAPPRFGAGAHADRRKFEQAHLALGWEGPAQTAPEQMPMQLFACASGGGMSSRLFQEVREERGLAYTIWSHHQPFADTGLFTAYLACAPGEAARARELTLKVLAATAAELSEAELARARAQLKAGLLMSLEAASGWADYGARQYLMHGRVVEPAAIVARIDATGVDEVRAAAAAMLARAPASATVGLRKAA